jgi:hypothetical protein
MPDYESPKPSSEFRIPAWLLSSILLGAALALLWLRSSAFVDSIPRPTFVISEIQASNWETLADADGDFSDWIEIYNPSSEPQVLTGWYITDDFEELTKWKFPGIELEGGGFIVVFASGKNRNQFLDDLHTNFKLDERGEYLALVDPSGQRIIHEFLPKFPSLSGDDSFGIRSSFFKSKRARNSGGYRRTAFFDAPSPGKANASGFWGQVSDTHFSQNGSLVDAPFRLVLDTETPNSEIRYTLDGSWPTAEIGTIYDSPILIDHTTVIRVGAFRENYKPSNIDTQSYLFRSNINSQRGRGLPDTWGVKGDWTVPADYEMDPDIVEDSRFSSRLEAGLNSLPAMSLVVEQSALFDRDVGIYSNSEASGREWERRGSIELLFPDGSKGFREDCGVRIQGGWSRRPEESPKHSFRLIFREQYGAGELAYPLFGKEEPKRFETLVLRAGCNNSWLHWNGEERARGDLLRDEWMRRSVGALGRPSSRGRFVHLFLNGVYWGIYNPCERPDADFLSTAVGGSVTDYESRNASKILSGNDDAWRRLFELANSKLNNPGSYQEVAALLDIETFIDFMLVQIYGGSSDWDRASNWYAGRRTNPAGLFQFYMWDGERSLEGLDVDITEFDDDLSPTRLFQRLRQSPSFRLKFAERARHALSDVGALGEAANRTRYAEMADQVRDAMILESARWGDYRRDVHPYRVGPYDLYDPETYWETEVKRLEGEYFSKRRENVVSQLKQIDLW